MAYQSGVYPKRCSGCGVDTFTVRADGYVSCSSCKLELKGLSGFNVEETDDLWIAVHDRLQFLEAQAEAEHEKSELKPHLLKRAENTLKLLNKLKNATARKGNTLGSVSG